MEYSHQPILDIAAICARHGLQHCIVSPGSRSAPITIAFARHPSFKTLSVSDERSAAFIALGIAEATQKTVVLVCTSGTATLNFAPALAEAYYKGLPLLVLTADRPPEWIDQWDGQTIRQQNLYHNFIVASFQLPDSFADQNQVWHSHRTVNDALILSQKGPVHINVPLREPFYPKPQQNLGYSEKLPFFQKLKVNKTLAWQEVNALESRLKSFSKVLIVKGQDKRFDCKLPANVPFVADVVSNPEQDCIAHHDLFLSSRSLDFVGLQPELLITYGKSLISKNLKLFLRKNPPKEHWHIGESYADVFQTLSLIIDLEPKLFFESISWPSFDGQYLGKWLAYENQIASLLLQTFDKGFFGLVGRFLSGLDEVDLHLANSMSVRYANFWGIKTKRVQVFANRGTSGIDGSTSTAIGHCLAKPTKKQVLLTGDVAFFYDRNAFWNHLPKENLIVFLINDKGGSIFKMIEGPAQQREADEFFVTRQDLSAQALANEFGFDYLCFDGDLPSQIRVEQFYMRKNTLLIEILSNSDAQAENFKEIKDFLHSNLNA